MPRHLSHKATRHHGCDQASHAVTKTTLCYAGLAVGPALAGSVAFPNVADGASVPAPVHLEFSVEGMEVRPAKEGLQEGTFTCELLKALMYVHFGHGLGIRPAPYP